jgi:hypothetical protein
MQCNPLHKYSLKRVASLRPVQEMRGFLAGIDTTIKREADRV